MGYGAIKQLSRYRSPDLNLDYDFGAYTTKEVHSGFYMFDKVRMYYF
jgi:hypothetical protein